MPRQGMWQKLKEKFSLQDYREAPDWQARVDEEKGSYVGLDLKELAQWFSRARAMKKDLEEEVKCWNTTLEALSQLLKENLEGQDVQKVTLDSGETVYLQVEPYPSVEDKDKLRAWVQAQGMAELLTVNYMTLRGLVTERLTSGEAPPDGVSVFIKTRVRCRGGDVAGE